MKKVLALILLALAGVTHAVTNTPTWTPSWTATPTFTPTPTFTETPIARRDPNKKRVYYSPAQIRMSDGITIPPTTPVTGTVYPAQTNNIPSFVSGTAPAGAEVPTRNRLSVPVDYQKPSGVSGTSYPLTLWLENAWNSTATNTAQVCVNVFGEKQNKDFSNTPNKYSLLGVTTNVHTLPNSYSLSQVSSTAKLVKLTMPLGITQVAACDTITVEIIRVGASGNLTIGGLDLEYNPLNNYNP